MLKGKTGSPSDQEGSVLRITQLENKLEQANDECSQLKKQVTQLKHSVSCLETDVRRVGGERQALEGRVRGMVDRGKLNQLNAQHKVSNN